MKKSFLFLAAVTLSTSSAHALEGNADVGSVAKSPRAGVLPKGKMKAVLGDLVRQGKSFEDSLGTLESKDDALFLTYPKGGACEHTFTVRYDSTYLMTEAEKVKSPLKGLPSDCSIVKQGKNSDLAQVFFCENKSTGSYNMTLGEGMPMVLGKFYPAKKEDALQREYMRVKKEKFGKRLDEEHSGTEPPDKFLVKVDLSQAESILKGKNTSEKEKVIENLASNLWTANSETVSQRMKLIKLGLTDADEKVQSQALRAFQQGGRVQAGVPVLQEWAKGFSKKTADLQLEAVSSISVLLYEAQNKISTLTQLENKYHASTPAEILKSSGGIIDAEDEKAFLDVCQRNTWQSTKNFTEQDHADLRALLVKIASDKSASPQAVAAAQRSLQDYKLPKLMGSKKAAPSSGAK